MSKDIHARANILSDIKISFWKEILFSLNFSFQKFLFKENFLPHKAATHNACALLRAMASNTREANTDDERALCTAAEKKDVMTLTSLLQKGVCPNVYDGNVCRLEQM